MKYHRHRRGINSDFPFMKVKSTSHFRILLELFLKSITPVFDCIREIPLLRLRLFFLCIISLSLSILIWRFRVKFKSCVALTMLSFTELYALFYWFLLSPNFIDAYSLDFISFNSGRAWLIDIALLLLINSAKSERGSCIFDNCSSQD